MTLEQTRIFRFLDQRIGKSKGFKRSLSQRPKLLQIEEDLHEKQSQLLYIMDAVENSFLDLPRSHGVKVEDLITFNPEDGAAHHSSKSNSGDSTTTTTTGAGTILVSKILDGLAQWGNYTDEDAQKVGNLVAKNLITCSSTQADQLASEPEDPTLVDGPMRTVDAMFKGMLQQTIPRSRYVHMNSNEPVMLINFDGPMSAERRHLLEYVYNIAITDLQQKWNIWPVRVYAGAFLPGSGGEKTGDFSITLLNVVNTEIGGPSMPQLLDSPCAAPEWNRCWRKEVWRGRDLVSREDDEKAWLGTGVVADDDYDSEQSVTSADDNESVGSDALTLAILNNPRQMASESPAVEREQDPTEEGENAGQEALEHDQPSAGTQTEEAVADDRDGSADAHDLAGASVQKQALPEQPDLPAKHIDHPSWERQDDSTSLLDLIRSQASLIAPFGVGSGGHGVADIEGDVAEVKPDEPESSSSLKDVGSPGQKAESKQAKSASDDDFVVV